MTQVSSWVCLYLDYYSEYWLCVLPCKEVWLLLISENCSRFVWIVGVAFGTAKIHNELGFTGRHKSYSTVLHWNALLCSALHLRYYNPVLHWTAHKSTALEKTTIKNTPRTCSAKPFTKLTWALLILGYREYCTRIILKWPGFKSRPVNQNRFHPVGWFTSKWRACLWLLCS